MDTKKIPLTGEYDSHDGKFKELVLREPTTRDYKTLKLPILIKIYPDGAQDVSVDGTLCLKWAALLSGKGELILDQLNKDDYWKVVSEVPLWIGDTSDDKTKISPKN